MPVKPAAPHAPDATGTCAGEADFTDLVAKMDCRALRSLAAGGPPPAAMIEAKRLGQLNRRHLPALLAITFSGPLSVSDLAGRLGLGLPTTSTLVGELSRAGLIERSECPTDRRRTIVRLAGHHREALGAWALDVVAPLRRTLERLTPDARAHFLEGWQIFYQETHASSPASCPAAPAAE